MNDVCEKCSIDLGTKYETDVKRLCAKHLEAIWIDIQDRLKKGEIVQLKTECPGRNPYFSEINPNSINLSHHLSLIKFAIQRWDVEVLN